MSLLTKVLGSLEARLNQPRVSLWRTLYFNFRTLPFGTAIKLPVFIYSKVHLFELNGKIKFENTQIKRGMVTIGRNADSFSLCDHSGFVQLASKDSLFVFEGPCRIALNAKIRCIAGELRFGKFSRIGSDTRVICNGGNIYIGAFSGITFGCTVMNSSFHYTYDENKQCYRDRTAPIYIGAYNWIGNQTIILGKCRTKDYTIVGAGSLLNHDYTKESGEYPMIAGRPGKIVATGIKRVFSPNAEKRISELFKKSGEHIVYSDEIEDHPENLIIEM